MFLPNSAGLRVRPRVVAIRVAAVVLACVASVPLALAHEGHDHGAAQAALPVTSQPRAAATGDAFEAVAVLKDGALLIFIDRFADNSPVTKAAVNVTVGSQEFSAQSAPDGTYRIRWPASNQTGRHDVVISIQDGATADLLIATLAMPSNPASLAIGANTPNPFDRLRGWIATRALPLTSALGALVVIGLAAALLVRWRAGQRSDVTNKNVTVEARAGQGKRLRGLPVLATLLMCGLAFYNWPVVAHEGDDHGADRGASLAITGDAPRRLPDGSVFVPKPTQRLLDVRTVLAKEAPQRPSQSLVGRVIANPNRSGLVQSSTGGRVTPPSTGLPRLGQSVKAGEILAYVTPAFQAIDSANVAQTAGDLEQQIALARTKLDRAQRLLASNAGTRVQVEETDLLLKGLERRRATLTTSEVRSEPLLAPVDGVISSTKAVPGQVVAPQDILFEIIDATSLWVEALVFDASASQTFEQPVASTQDGKTFALTLVGRSRSLRQQSVIVQFEVDTPSASLDVGMPVTVHALSGEPITAIVLPKAAVVRAPSGEDIVWRHTEPERFVATPVKVAPFDGAHVLVQSGLSSGQRIVVQSAELINQVR